MSMSEEQLLRLQLERDLAMYEGAGMEAEKKATKTRLAELDKPEPEPKKATAAKKDEVK